MSTFALPWTPETRRQYCQCAGCKPNSANARANVAIRMLRTQREFGRPFEHCFEMPDQDDVVREITRRAAADRTLADSIRRKGYGYWLDPSQYAWLWENEPHPFSIRTEQAASGCQSPR